MEFTEARRAWRACRRAASISPIRCRRRRASIIGNVYVMAGVPQVFQAMLDNVLPTLRTGTRMLSLAIACPYGEGEIGTPLAAIQKAHPETSIGSYPRYVGQTFSTEIVVRAVRRR